MCSRSSPSAEVRARIITSPKHMKRLVAAMVDNLQKYEAKYWSGRSGRLHASGALMGPAPPPTEGDLGRRMTEHVELLQDSICAALEARRTARAASSRTAGTGPAGGGGRTRVMAGGRVFEKAGVNVSSVWGARPSVRPAAPGRGSRFFATGLSLILHPLNPRVPTVHANWRFIQQRPEGLVRGAAPTSRPPTSTRRTPGTSTGCSATSASSTSLGATSASGGVRPLLLDRPSRRGPGEWGNLLREHRPAPGAGVRLRPGLRTCLPPQLPAHRAAPAGLALDTRAEALAAPPPRPVRRVQPGLRPGHPLRPADAGADGEHPGLAAARGGLGLRCPPCTRAAREARLVEVLRTPRSWE